LTEFVIKELNFSNDVNKTINKDVKNYEKMINNINNDAKLKSNSSIEKSKQKSSIASLNKKEMTCVEDIISNNQFNYNMSPSSSLIKNNGTIKESIRHNDKNKMKSSYDNKIINNQQVLNDKEYKKINERKENNIDVNNKNNKNNNVTNNDNNVNKSKGIISTNNNIINNEVNNNIQNNEVIDNHNVNLGVHERSMINNSTIIALDTCFNNLYLF